MSSAMTIQLRWVACPPLWVGMLEPAPMPTPSRGHATVHMGGSKPLTLFLARCGNARSLLSRRGQVRIEDAHLGPVALAFLDEILMTRVRLVFVVRRLVLEDDEER